MRILCFIFGMVLFALSTVVALVMIAPMWVAVGIYYVSEFIHDHAVDGMNEAADMIGHGIGVDDDHDPFGH